MSEDLELSDCVAIEKSGCGHTDLWPWGMVLVGFPDGDPPCPTCTGHYELIEDEEHGDYTVVVLNEDLELPWYILNAYRER